MINNTISDAQTIAGGGGAMLAGRYRIVRQLEKVEGWFRKFGMIWP